MLYGVKNAKCVIPWASNRLLSRFALINRPVGDGLESGGALLADDPPNMEKIPPLRTRSKIDPPTWGGGGHRGLAVGVFDCGLRFESPCTASYRSTSLFPSGP